MSVPHCPSSHFSVDAFRHRLVVAWLTSAIDDAFRFMLISSVYWHDEVDDELSRRRSDASGDAGTVVKPELNSSSDKCWFSLGSSSKTTVMALMLSIFLAFFLEHFLIAFLIKLKVKRCINMGIIVSEKSLLISNKDRCRDRMCCNRQWSNRYML